MSHLRLYGCTIAFIYDNANKDLQIWPGQIYQNWILTKLHNLHIINKKEGTRKSNRKRGDSMENQRMMKAVNRESQVSSVLMMTITAMFIALTYVFTAFVNVRLPIGGNGGLIHLGNIPLFICAMLYGKKSAAIAGSVGMAAFDLFLGWTAWAPFTFVIVGAMGYVAGAITEKKKSYVFKVVAVFVALVIKIVGYYIAEGLIYHNWVAPVLSIPGNILQVATAGIIVLLIIVPLEGIANRIH